MRAAPNRTEVAPESFQPQSPPADDGQMRTWLVSELARLSAIVNVLVLAAPQVARTAPTPPLEGMIRLAKGGWNPTAHGGYDPNVGVLIRYVGGAWHDFA